MPIFNLQNITLLIAALINLLMSILSRKKSNA